MTEPQDIDRRALLRGRWRKRPEQSPVYRRHRTVRPPGANRTDEFLELCNGCGACVSACPYKAIYLTAAKTTAGEASPEMFPSVSACRLCEDTPCIAACDTGALMPLERQDIRLAHLRVVAENCWAANGTDPDCDACAQACPVRARAISVSSGRAPILFESGCTGCGLCYHACLSPAKALRVEAF
jgi:ferredoxin-type protein NapG